MLLLQCSVVLLLPQNNLLALLELRAQAAALVILLDGLEVAQLQTHRVRPLGLDALQRNLQTRDVAQRQCQGLLKRLYDLVFTVGLLVVGVVNWRRSCELGLQSARARLVRQRRQLVRVVLHERVLRPSEGLFLRNRAEIPGDARLVRRLVLKQALEHLVRLCNSFLVSQEVVKLLNCLFLFNCLVQVPFALCFA